MVWGGVLLLMAVVKLMKNKVRLVLDFREVNVYMACHTHGDTIDICLETETMETNDSEWGPKPLLT